MSVSRSLFSLSPSLSPNLSSPLLYQCQGLIHHHIMHHLPPLFCLPLLCLRSDPALARSFIIIFATSSYTYTHSSPATASPLSPPSHPFPLLDLSLVFHLVPSLPSLPPIPFHVLSKRMMSSAPLLSSLSGDHHRRWLHVLSRSMWILCSSSSSSLYSLSSFYSFFNKMRRTCS